VLIEPTGAVIDRVDDNHTATTDTDGDQKCLEGCSEEVTTAAGAVKPARQRQPSQEEARDRVLGAPRPTEDGTSSRRMLWGTMAK